MLSSAAAAILLLLLTDDDERTKLSMCECLEYIKYVFAHARMHEGTQTRIIASSVTCTLLKSSRNTLCVVTMKAIEPCCNSHTKSTHNLCLGSKFLKKKIKLNGFEVSCCSDRKVHVGYRRSKYCDFAILKNMISCSSSSN